AGEERRFRLSRVLGTPLSTAAAVVSQALGIYGPQATFSTACSSSALAVALAADAIRRGEARVALALGADGLCRLTYAGFDALQALDPDRCRPFDRDRRGLSLGEEAAVTVLALDEGIVPPTVGLRAPDPAWADLDLVCTPGRRAPLGAALTSSYGFGGHNVTLVLGRAEGR